MTWQVLEGDCLDVLRSLDAGSVQTCVTSPPYWGLRDYGTAAWEGGDSECDHKTPPSFSKTTLGEASGGNAMSPEARARWAEGQRTPYRDVCANCGAKRIDSQLGLEPTPEQYVENLVAVFREVRRVLRDDGTVWLNLGDSYASGGGSWASNAGNNQRNVGAARSDDEGAYPHTNRRPPAGLKAKDLVGIPWRVAFALQADGWWLRSDIVWAKPNPMPESVTDRPTRSHEYIFLLTKSARYFYDADAIREGAVSDHPSGNGYARDERESYRNADGTARGQVEGWNDVGGSRNRRSVWTVTTQPFPGAHFATFPPKLIEPCVLAGSAEEDTVLDPFAGAGTTGVVALRHGRAFTGIELNPEYAEMARERIRAFEVNPNGYLEGDPESVEGQLGLLDGLSEGATDAESHIGEESDRAVKANGPLAESDRATCPVCGDYLSAGYCESGAAQGDH